MNKGLEAFEEIKTVMKKLFGGVERSEKALDTVEKELKESDKIKARLVVVNMKLTSKRKECVENMNHTDEDDFLHEASKIEMDCLDWFKQLLQEVLL